MVISSNRKGIDGMSTLSDYIADFLKSLADPVKIDLIKLLKNNKKNSKEIQEELDISQAHASQKVNELIKTGILSSEKIENIKYYTLKNYDILKFLSYSASFVLDLEKKRLENLRKMDDIEKVF
jgi:DNA-binding transcriptional ArsR family regulator